MRRTVIAVLVGVVAAVLSAPASASSAQSATREFLVLYKAGVSPAAARAAVKAAGGTVVRENTAVGLATVRASAADFKQAAGRQGAIAGVAGNRPIGVSPRVEVPRSSRTGSRRRVEGPVPPAGSLAPLRRPPPSR